MSAEQHGRVRDLIARLRLQLHKNVRWEMEDYDLPKDGEPDRDDTTDITEAEAVSSRVSGTNAWDVSGYGFHHVLLDIDHPGAELVPSSTPGHSHLYVPLPGGVSWEKYAAFLDAAADIDLIEKGYAEASKARFCTSLRLPWVHKGEEREAVANGGVLPPKQKPVLPADDPWASAKQAQEDPF